MHLSLNKIPFGRRTEVTPANLDFFPTIVQRCVSSSCRYPLGLRRQCQGGICLVRARTQCTSTVSFQETLNARPCSRMETAGFPYFAYEEKHLNAHGDSELPEPFGFIQPGNKSTWANGTALKGPHKCKVYPGDPNWPSLHDWAAFDNLTGRALLKPTPEAHVCYDNATTDNGTNNAAQSAACLDLTDKWTNPFTQ